MTHEELIVSVSQVEPEMFEKTAQLLAITEKMVPEFAQEASQDFASILDFTREKMAECDEQQEKLAMGGHGGGMGGRMGAGLMGAIGKGLDSKVGRGIGAGIGTALLSSIATDLYDAATRKLTKASRYKAIVRQNPELLTKFTPAELQKSFSTLHGYAPEFTSDPQLGAQLLGAMAETAGTMGQFSTLKDLINSRKTLNETRRRSFEPRFQFGPRKGGGEGDKIETSLSEG
jgi:hypothetical protein